VSVFVDTSAWYAAADLGDVHHGRAVERLSLHRPRIATLPGRAFETADITVGASARRISG